MMKQLKNIVRTGVLMLLSAWAVSSCTEKSDWDIDPSFSRPFGTDENGIGVETDNKVARATVTWNTTQSADYYLIEVSPNELTTETPLGTEGSVIYGNDPQNRITKAPYTLDNLAAGTTYYLRIKLVTEQQESRWVLHKRTFSSVKQEEILNAPLSEDLPQGTGKVRLTWEAGLAVTRFEILETGAEESTVREISAAEAASGEAWIEELKTFTEYTFTIFNGDVARGAQTVTVPGLVIDSSISNITENSALFAWDSSVDVNQYAVLPATEGVPTAGTALSAAEIAAHQILLTGLKAETEYTAYAFANGSICSRITFTTRKGKPAGYTEMTWEEAIADWDALSGKVLINVSGTEGFAQEKEVIPAAVTHLLFWGNSATEQVPMSIKKGLGAAGTCQQIAFHNLHITDEGNTTLIYQNTAKGGIKEVSVTSCTITDIRGVIRLNASAPEAMKLIIDDVVFKGMGKKATSNLYGFFLSDKVLLTAIDLQISNSTLFSGKGNSASVFIRHKAGQTGSVSIENCTFFDMAAADALFRDTKAMSITVTNTLFAKGGVRPFYGTGAVATDLTLSGVYHSADFSFAATDWGKAYTGLELSADQLFPNASGGDLTYGADVPEELRRIGDQRWNK